MFGKKQEKTYTFKNKKGGWTTTTKRPKGKKGRDWDKEEVGCLGCAPVLLLFALAGGYLAERMI